MTDKSVTDLRTDIYTVLNPLSDHEPDSALAAQYAMNVGGEFAKATLRRDKPREKGRLWASDLGKECMRQQWYRFNMPEKEEVILGHTKFKFLYGNIIEEAVLYFAEEAGHDVRDQQARVELPLPDDWQVTGRIDAVIDNALIDVKSTSSYGYNKFRYGINPENDTFGYLWQLGFYRAYAEVDHDPELSGFVWVDKQNGHIQYTRADVPDESQIVARAMDIIQSVDQPTDSDVPRAFEPEPYGKSGNLSLPTNCSYCPFKQECHKDSNDGKGIRTFKYGHKPVDLVKVVREPKVEEITKDA